MSAVMMQSRVERYLAERRRLGFAMRGTELQGFAQYVGAIGHRGPVTVELMTDWARRDKRGSKDPQTWARRLKKLRSFMRWLQQFDPRTPIPDDAIFGPCGQRLAPHIYSEQEIVDLLAAARRIGPATGLRGAMYEALFGLIACTGMRISEALSLSIASVDLKAGRLIVRRTKFGKSRQIPLHPTAVQVLRRYRHLRDVWVAPGDEAPFFVATRGRLLGQRTSSRQAARVFRGLCRQLGWRNRGAHHAPRIHDLRHTFVVHRMVLWHQQGVDIDQAMLSLATYVGHSNVTNTYWYLSAVPELLAIAGRRFESFKAREVGHA